MTCVSYTENEAIFLQKSHQVPLIGDQQIKGHNIHITHWDLGPDSI